MMSIIVTIGKYDEALVYYKEALDASRSILGNTHPSTLACISNMGNILYSRRKTMIVVIVFCNTYW